MKDRYNSETVDGDEKQDSESNKSTVQEWKWFLSKFSENSSSLLIVAINKKFRKLLCLVGLKHEVLASQISVVKIQF